MDGTEIRLGRMHKRAQVPPYIITCIYIYYIRIQYLQTPGKYHAGSQHQNQTSAQPCSLNRGRANLSNPERKRPRKQKPDPQSRARSAYRLHESETRSSSWCNLQIHRHLHTWRRATSDQRPAATASPCGYGDSLLKGGVIGCRRCLGS
jgi:hypothetical protein